MGEYHVKKWVEAIESIDHYPLWAFDRRTMSIALSVCILIMVLSYAGILICALNSCCQAVFPLLAVSILAAILSIFCSARRTKNESGWLCCQKRWSGALVKRFLDAEELTPSKLPQITESVKSYYCDRTSARKTFMDRAFALFVCGLFVTAVSVLISTWANFNIVSLAFSLVVCLLAVVIPAAVSAFWDLIDSFHVASIQRTKSMLLCLECYALSD